MMVHGVATLVILLICTGGGYCDEGVDITTDAPAGLMDELVNVSITCIVEKTPHLATVTLIAQAPGEPIKVVTNQVVEAAFRNRLDSNGAKRYKAAFEYNIDTTVSTLQVSITGILIEDAGKFLCEMQSGTTKLTSDTVELKVKVPVSLVSMAIIYPNKTLAKVTDGHTVGMTYNVKGGVACIVSVESYVVTPVVNITVNGKASPVKFMRDAVRRADGNPGMYEYVYRYMTGDPHYTMDDGDIRCRAHTNGYEDMAKQASVIGQATYRPVIVCAELRPLATVGGEGELTCLVWSNPKLTVLQVHFGLTVGDKMIDFQIGTAKTEKYTLLREDTNKTSNVTFKIQHMTPVFFDKYKYLIKAESKLGSTIQTFTFIKEVISQTSTFWPSWLLMTLTSILVISKLTQSS